MTDNTYYETTGQVLRKRIEALIPEHPEILTMENPFDLFKIDREITKGLDPTLAMAGAALAIARQRYKARQSDE